MWSKKSFDCFQKCFSVDEKYAACKYADKVIVVSFLQLMTLRKCFSLLLTFVGQFLVVKFSMVITGELCLQNYSSINNDDEDTSS